jgi:hypothetical protein
MRLPPECLLKWRPAPTLEADMPNMEGPHPNYFVDPGIIRRQPTFAESLEKKDRGVQWIPETGTQPDEVTVRATALAKAIDKRLEALLGQLIAVETSLWGSTCVQGAKEKENARMSGLLGTLAAANDHFSLISAVVDSIQRGL